MIEAAQQLRRALRCVSSPPSGCPSPDQNVACAGRSTGNVGGRSALRSAGKDWTRFVGGGCDRASPR